MAAGGGLLLFISLPPRGWWWAGVAGIALFSLAVRQVGGRGRVGLGYVAGLAWFAPALVWVAGFSLPGAWLLVALQAGFLALVAAVVPRGSVVLLPAALVVGEWLRGSWPVGGFPLAGPALGQVDAPFVSVGALGGPLALVAVAATAGVALSELATGRRRTAAGLAVVVVVAALAGVAARSATSSVGAPLAVAVVQGGGPRGIPAVAADPGDAFARHLEVSRRIPAGTDLIVWPENVVDVTAPVASTREGASLGALAKAAEATLIAGVTEDVGGHRFRNAAIAWDPSGRPVGRYDKVHRVPFGEYVPGRALLSRVVDLSLVPRDAIPGEGSGLLVTPAGRIGVAVSFEVFFPDRVRAAVSAGSRMIVVPTNAASFTTDEVPAQELAAARLRAIESGRPVLQAAPTGYSALVSPDGTVQSRSELGAAQLLTGAVDLRDGATPYMRLGDVPVVVTAVVVLAVGWLPASRKIRLSVSYRPSRCGSWRAGAWTCP